ncbi:MAG TPA: DoxX family protein [Chitinophagaceae bacterium]|nr:DoxX family protein [Chitinophagaceae bacterium]
MNFQAFFIWVLRLVAAVLMLQTLFFKFTGAEESIYIFTQVGMEPWGRIGSGVLELIASALILYPRTTHFGALLGIGLMSGAIFFHLTKLGLEIQGDGGLLFFYASAVFVSCIILVIIFRERLFTLFKKA